MTFWDNSQMITNHIRHSCVTSDDTGMCEMVIVQDEPDIFNAKQRKRLGMFNSDEGSDYSDYSQSFDIAVSPGVMGRTPKSNRYDRTRRSKQEHHCKNIHWDENNVEKLTEDVKNEIFKEKIVVENAVNLKKTSELSVLLQNSLNQPSNPFVEYAKYDGEGLDDTYATKYIEFFLTFVPEEERIQPMNVSFVETACVQDVIGLVLYKYVLEGRRPRVQADVKAYALHIAEEDGEVDTDFPALDDKESMAKFGFQYLALVEKHKVNRGGPPVKNSVSVKILVPQNGYSVVKVDRTDVQMKTILAKLLKKRGIRKNGREYRLEKPNEEGHYVDMEQTLESIGSFTFHLVRDNGIRKKEEKDLENTSSAQAEIMSLQYKSYQVLLTHRLLPSTEVSLGIHGEKIEIDPVAQPKSQKFFARVKPISLDVNNIADCEIIEEKPGRAVFRIYYKKTDDFKHYEFETIPQIADEILRKIHYILESRPQLVRADFLNNKKRTLEKTKRR